MRENPGTTPAQPVEASGTKSKRASSLARTSLFRYYIHDGISTCRLQLIGELTEADIFDLNGCWRTVKTTLNNRQLLLDLHGLRTVDEAGKQWLACVAQDGGICSPEQFLRDLVAGKHTGAAILPPSPAKTGLLSRIVGILRGVRVEAVK